MRSIRNLYVPKIIKMELNIRVFVAKNLFLHLYSEFTSESIQV